MGFGVGLGLALTLTLTLTLALTRPTWTPPVQASQMRGRRSRRCRGSCEDKSAAQAVTAHSRTYTRT